LFFIRSNYLNFNFFKKITKNAGGRAGKVKEERESADFKLDFLYL